MHLGTEEKTELQKLGIAKKKGKQIGKSKGAEKFGGNDDIWAQEGKEENGSRNPMKMQQSTCLMEQVSKADCNNWYQIQSWIHLKAVDFNIQQMTNSEDTISDPLHDQQASTLPPWWETQSKLIESRFRNLETATDENKGYLQRILKLMSAEADTIAADSPEQTQQVKAPKNPLPHGKSPVPIILLNDAPGILSSKPSAPNDQQPFPKQTTGNSYFEQGNTSDPKDPFVPHKTTTNIQNTYLPRPKLELPTFDGIAKKKGKQIGKSKGAEKFGGNDDVWAQEGKEENGSRNPMKMQQSTCLMEQVSKAVATALNS
ncbi:hypothetical protein V6N11_075456 [Hibiscus sabdariffa]|uniref:Uncharacterized protein n=1 Tax=Hibiscus sabdariffa TaxID=183260 RepID=A0ABR2R6L3_9ROSI